MAGELRHADVGGILSRAEWEDIVTHILEGQATGDLMFVDADGRIRRIPISQEGDQLTVINGLPAWGPPSATLVTVATEIAALVNQQTNPTIGTMVA